LIEFKVAEHLIHLIREGPVIEVWMNGKFKMAIYSIDDGIRLISTHVEDGDVYQDFVFTED
jgi:hypothetical protein